MELSLEISCGSREVTRKDSDEVLWQLPRALVIFAALWQNPLKASPPVLVNALSLRGLDYLFPKTKSGWSLSWADLTKNKTNSGKEQTGFLACFNAVKVLSEGFDTCWSGPDGRKEQCSWEGRNGVKRRGVRSIIWDSGMRVHISYHLRSEIRDLVKSLL